MFVRCVCVCEVCVCVRCVCVCEVCVCEVCVCACEMCVCVRCEVCVWYNYTSSQAAQRGLSFSA